MADHGTALAETPWACEGQRDAWVTLVTVLFFFLSQFRLDFAATNEPQI